MPKRKIIKIDESKCTGCGECIVNCHENALQIIDGKARLVSDVYCDGLGACLGSCPEGAITIEERDADAFDEEAVRARQPRQQAPVGGGCPGSAVRSLNGLGASCPAAARFEPDEREKVVATRPTPAASSPSRLTHWPVQLSLVPPTAPFLRGTDVLLVADCVPVAVPDFHERFLKGHAMLLACPKLDNVSAYIDKMVGILEGSGLKSLTILHMEVPCCSGLNRLVRQAAILADSAIPVKEITLSLTGEVVSEEEWEGVAETSTHPGRF
ncbi:MAG TPA: 4Fe-4S dicluster domain-containing protein [Candidatus Sumerlaeota bacterium]|nr:4Fe-4S dicluster domain-containing protein [Candidatus Sumerlaeota bacterium]HPS01955.1 4Fe-4S dicluster domain-containing protein [Candidatus Sumerlaeota bacterium]